MHTLSLRHACICAALYNTICLIFYLEPQCATLVPRTKGLEMVCYNGYDYTTGEVYEGDTCSFTCNSGYELTGSDTRTCQSDGSWNGTEAVCKRGVLI